MKAQEKSAEYLVGSQSAEWKRGALGELLPIKYGKSLPGKLRDTTGSHPVFGSSGQVGTHSAALTLGPTLIIGRKGNVGAIHYSGEACWPIDTVYYVEPPEGQNLRYYKYLLESLNLVKLDRSTAVPGLSRDDYNAVEVVVAPPEQQDEIVAEIEKQFSRLDEAVANLKRVKANLKRYKAAVLKAAVEGKLTEAWRKQHPDTESASELLPRILEERRAKWEQAELAKMQAKSKAPKDDTWKKKYPEPAAQDTTDLPELPEGWRWAKTDQLFWFVTSGSRGWAEYYSDEGAQFLRIGNLDHDSISIDFSDLQRVNPPNGAEGTRTRVEPGDILVSITADVGMIAIAPCDIGESFINQHISLARPVSSINGSFLAWHLCAKNGQDQFKELQRGATKAGLGLVDIRAVNIGLPPLEEQKFIVDEIERHFTLANVAEAQVDMNLKRAYRLRQSVLALSFSGKMFIRGLVNGG